MEELPLIPPSMKKLFNHAPLIVASVLITYPFLSDRVSYKVSFLPQVSLKLPQKSKDATVWRVGSIYDGDTLRVVRGNEELKIRFCGTDSPELKQTLGVEARDYLRTGFAWRVRVRS